MNRETKETSTPDKTVNMSFPNTLISPITPPAGISLTFERGESSSAKSNQPPTDPNISNENKENTVPSGGPRHQFHNNSQSRAPIPPQFHDNPQWTAPTPQPLYSMFDVCKIYEQSALSTDFLAKHINALQGGHINVNTFVMKLQEVNDCEDSPLSTNLCSYNPTLIKKAVTNMMNATILWFIHNRDSMRVYDERSRQEWVRFNSLITELVKKRDSM